VTLALADRGFKAYDSESMKGVTRLEYKATGEPADWPEAPINWDIYDFVWQEDGLRKLIASADVVFIGASVGNQEKFYFLFDKVFVLTLDNQHLKARLASRDKSFGKHPEELAGILAYNVEQQNKYMSAPYAVTIDASRSLDQIIDNILGHVNTAGK